MKHRPTPSILFISTMATVLALLASGCGDSRGEREFRAARRALKHGRTAQARSLLEKSISHRPGRAENAAAYNYLGLVCYRLGETERAQDAFSDSIQLNPEYMSPVLNAGLLDLDNRKFFEASTKLEEAALLAPHDPRPYEFLAQMHMHRGAYAQALKALNLAEERNPQSPRIATAKALASLQVSGNDEAERLLMVALSHDSTYPPALYDLALIKEYLQKQPQDALAFYQEFLESSPKNARAGQARDALARLSAYRSNVVAETTEPEPGTEYIERLAPMEEIEEDAVKEVAATVPEEPAVTEPAPPPPSLEDQAREAARLGRQQDAYRLCSGAATRATNPTEKEKYLRLAAQLAPTESRAHYMLGEFLAAQKRIEEALPSYRRAVQLDPEWVGAQHALGRQCLKAGLLNEALEALHKAALIDPKQANIAWDYAEALRQRDGQNEAVAQAYKAFADKFPSDSRSATARSRAMTQTSATARGPEEEVTPAPEEKPAGAPERPWYKRKRPEDNAPAEARKLFNFGAEAQAAGDDDLALRYYRETVKVNPRFAEAWLNQGVIHQNANRSKEARDAYIQALDINPDLVNARYNLGLIYYDLNEQDKATREFRTLLKSHPEHAYSHFMLGLIYSGKQDTLNMARMHYRRFLLTEPNAPEAQAVRSWLAR